MQLGSKGSIYFAVGVIALGFLAIFLGWNGAAGKDYVSGQIPYIVSGGFAGLGLVAAGLALALTEARRRDNAKMAAKLDRLLEHFGAQDQEEAPAVSDRIVGLRRSRAKKAS